MRVGIGILSLIDLPLSEELRLNTHSAELFRLGTNSTTSLSVVQYLQLMNWLGDPSLTSNQTIPATFAIEFCSEILTNNVTVNNLFKGCCSRAELDCLSERDKTFLGPIVRLIDGRITFDENNNINYVHRNLVLTDYQGKVFHKLMFSFNVQRKFLCPGDESQKPRYVRRNNKHDREEFSQGLYNLLPILTSFNTKLLPNASVSYDKEIPATAFKSLLALTTLGCLGFNMSKRVYPEMQVKQIRSALRP